MPSGKTHDFFNILVLIVGIAVVFSYNLLADQMDEDVLKNCLYLFLGSYIFSTFMLSPDLDLHKNRSKLNWGFLRFIWYPYSKIFSHRGISHSLIFGILTRLVYIYFFYFLGLLAYWYYSDIDFEDLRFLFVEAPGDFEIAYGITFLAGIYFPSILHSILDWFVSSVKKSKK
ncbi:MAG TPA: hypothetical protein DHW82_13555 [Spirochaetia bacterium]|nr:MAG: hypothetical protein A2Y41_09205 [Spirochaetes bacterium GWB1_36_13]HCL58015.1 hypothetical protein [Spirochaetia bacterium]